MSVDERITVATVLEDGCPQEMPDNTHISLDLVRRQLGVPAAQVIDTLSGIGSLGFSFSLRDSHGPSDDLASDGPLVVLTWSNRAIDGEEGFEGEPLAVACTMLEVLRESYCEEHAREAIENLDFGSLATATDDHDQEHEDDVDEDGEWSTSAG